jgi:two-component system sensor histidine kinase KdpD
VEDDGCGIAEERMAHLFTGLLDSETKVDSGRSNMGIGLSVCNAIIKAHGSEITAANRPEGGAEFDFALDLDMEDTKNGK